MSKTLITWVAIIVLVILGVMLFKNKSVETVVNEINNGDNSLNQPVVPVNTTVTSTTSAIVVVTPPIVKTFTVSGSNFKFTPSTMTVNKGDTVRITFKNVSGTHDLKLDEFNAATKVLQVGSEETIEFVADKTGSFEYYCSIGQHRQMGMKGTLTVQ